MESFERTKSDGFCDNRPTVAAAPGLPLLHTRAIPVFSAIQPETLNDDPAHVRRLVTGRAKAIVWVHYGVLACGRDELQAIADVFGVALIEDAAHTMGPRYCGQPKGSAEGNAR